MEFFRNTIFLLTEHLQSEKNISFDDYLAHFLNYNKDEVLTIKNNIVIFIL